MEGCVGHAGEGTKCHLLGVTIILLWYAQDFLRHILIYISMIFQEIER